MKGVVSLIPIEQCKVGGLYKVQSRNLRHAVFAGTGFIGVREKMGARFLDTEFPFGTGRGGNVVVLEQLAQIPPIYN